MRGKRRMGRPSQTEAQQRILSAAKERLWQYGFKKTTIDEIAADAGVGKGTVYLYFESKEDIAIHIIVQSKTAAVEHMEQISRDPLLGLKDRLKRVLVYSPLSAFDVMRRCPAALELILAIKPHIRERTHPLTVKELQLIANILEEGIESGEFIEVDPVSTARTLKLMMGGFYPPYPCVSERNEIEDEICRIIDLAMNGISRTRQEVFGRPRNDNTDKTFASAL